MARLPETGWREPRRTAQPTFARVSTCRSSSASDAPGVGFSARDPAAAGRPSAGPCGTPRPGPAAPPPSRRAATASPGRLAHAERRRPGPITAIQIGSAAGTFWPWSVQSSGVVAAAVVGREHERRPPAVGRQRLRLLPEPAHEAVGAPGRVEVDVVAPAVGPAVRLAEHHVEDAGLARAQVLEGALHRGRVEALVGPVGRQVVVKSFSSRSRSLAGSSTAGPSPFACTPERSAATMKGSTSQLANAATRPSKPGRLFSHSSTVRFGFGFLSLLSTRGSAKPAQHLVVAGVGEPEAVRDPHAAAARRVAQDLAVAGDDRPDEGQQRLAPGLGRRPIEARRRAARASRRRRPPWC